MAYAVTGGGIQYKAKHKWIRRAVRFCPLVHKVELHQLLQMTPEARAYALNQEHLKTN
ncbi:hypothetical protein BT93_B2312 [Corymbia citriodora subsp. variegata]|nr:hypothetical protein BT93_B2312 [Corymbia citriodora subsp. variegata]